MIFHYELTALLLLVKKKNIFNLNILVTELTLFLLFIIYRGYWNPDRQAGTYTNNMFADDFFPRFIGISRSE